MPLLSWIAKTEFSKVLTKLRNAFLNDIGEVNDFMSSLKLCHSWEESGENDLLKLTVLEAVSFLIFFAWIWFGRLDCCGVEDTKLGI